MNLVHWLAFASGLSVAGAAPTAAQGSLPVWHLSAQPTLTIGESGNPNTEFAFIGGVLRLSTGEIVVANGASKELRVFDATGAFLRALSRAGRGPGEFTNISWVGHAADTILVYDGGQRRLSLLGAHKGYLSSIALMSRNTTRGVYVSGHFPSGAWMIASWTSPTLNGPQRIYRDTAHFGVMPPGLDGEATWIGDRPGMSLFVFNPANADHGQMVGAYLPGAATRAVLCGEQLWVGDSGQNEVVSYDERGLLVHRVRLPLPQRAFSREDITAFRAQALFGAPTSPQVVAYADAMLEPKLLPKWRPFFSDLLPGSDGQVWVESFEANKGAPHEYLVVSPAGVIVARISTPAGMKVGEIGRDYVLGVHTDDDGVETVVLYTLRRS